MSYDLTFSTEAARAAVAAADPDDDDNADDEEHEDDSPPPAEAWSRLVERAAEVTGPVETSLTDSYGELDTDYGIQLIVHGSSATITVPYHHPDAATEVIATIYRLARIVEEELGLVGYDPQLDRRTAEVANDLAEPTLSYASVATMFEPGEG